MDKETREQLIDECIGALQQANKVLNKNIREIQDASRPLEKKQELLEEWDSEHLKINPDLLIDFDDIEPSNLTEQIQDSIQTLRKLKADFYQYINLIDREFNKLAPGKLDKIADLLESNGE